MEETLEHGGWTMDLYRPKQDRVIAGVCAGLARRFGLKPWTVRLIALLSCVLPGPQFVIYIALWIMMPSRDEHVRGPYATHTS